MRFPMKMGDALPFLQIQCFEPDGVTPKNLSGFTSLIFRMHKPGEPRKVDAPATPVDPEQGVIEYRWQEGDTDEIGQFRGVFVVNGDDTYPKDGYINVVIEETV